MFQRASGIFLFQIPMPESCVLTNIVWAILDHCRQEYARFGFPLLVRGQVKPLAVGGGKVKPVVSDQLLRRVGLLRDELTNRLQLERGEEVTFIRRAEFTQREACLSVTRKLPGAG